MWDDVAQEEEEAAAAVAAATAAATAAGLAGTLSDETLPPVQCTRAEGGLNRVGIH